MKIKIENMDSLTKNGQKAAIAAAKEIADKQFIQKLNKLFRLSKKGLLIHKNKSGDEYRISIVFNIGEGSPHTYYIGRMQSDDDVLEMVFEVKIDKAENTAYIRSFFAEYTNDMIDAIDAATAQVIEEQQRENDGMEQRKIRKSMERFGVA